MKKFVSLVLMVVLVISVFSGCGTPKDKNNNVVNAEFSEYLIAEKVGTLNTDDFMTAEGGVYYKGENDLWGVLSFNGMYDTGAIFTDVTPRGKYFEVSKVVVSNENDIKNLNASYLIDSKGKTIVSGYATFNVLNDRYIVVAKGTERTYSNDEAVLSFTDNGLSCYGSSYDILYKGVWAVYDIVSQKFVPKATGSQYSTIFADGRYFWFNDPDGNTVRINEKGESLPKDALLFEDGSYSLESKEGQVYNGNGELMFSYDLAGYNPSGVSNGYYIANKYSGDDFKYVVMNNKGEVISTEFDSYITIYGDLVYCDGEIFNLQGKKVLDGTYETVCFDKMFENNWMLENEDYYTMIDKNGNVFFNGPSDKTHNVYTSDFLASKQIEDETYFYSYKDKDYTIKGHVFAPWLVKTPNNNSLYDLVDTMTGKKLLEGYKAYDYISRNSLAYYVYAKYDGGADVYLVVSGAQLEDVINKKNNLFDDLVAAFAKEGIKVTVDKETGEIALDTSVLFGGDSAELTSEGKEFLDKFIKVYTNVVFSDKYDGFISKTMIEGHTAPVEGSTYAGDMKLSKERAENVKNYCLSAKNGVDMSKIADSFNSVGFSNGKPVYNDDGSVNMVASRRVSFRFIVNVDF